MNESEYNGISDYICLCLPDLGLERSSAIFCLRSEVTRRPLRFFVLGASSRAALVFGRCTCLLTEDGIYLVSYFVERNSLEDVIMELGRVEHMPREKYFSFVESKTTAAGDPSCQLPNQLSPSIIGEARSGECRCAILWSRVSSL